MTAAVQMSPVADAARVHSRALWGLCYRMTGDAAEADDLVQETFVRAIEKPRTNTALPLEHWLVRVALNLARDRLRQRRRQAYPSPWLPSPIETGGDDALTVSDVLPAEKTPAGRYELLESVTLAFLLALEVLTPQQRAVLLLRDVFDYSVREAADCLALSEANVKTTHLRARRAMAAYDATPRASMASRQHQTLAALSELTRCLIENDDDGAGKLLSDSVRSLSDGGGEFFAANVPVAGLRKVLKFTQRLYEQRGPPSDAQLRTVNGLPALVLTYTDLRPREAPRVVFILDVGADGRVLGLHYVLATRKLRAIRS